MGLSKLAGVAVAGLLGYAVLCHQLRYRRRSEKHAQYPYKSREDFAQMTVQHAHEILLYLSQTEFPFTIEKALEFALFKTYGIPTISKLLLKTRQLSESKYAPRRYCDTVVLLREFTQNPPNSKRANSAIARMNWLHGRFKNDITQEDLLYTLGLFAGEPESWIRRFEWRELTPMEICAYGTFWKAIGDAMQISYSELPSYEKGFKDGLQWFEELRIWCQKYEERAMVPAESNFLVAKETVSLLLWFVPKPLHPFGNNAVSALMDDRLRQAMKFQPPPSWVESLVFGLLKTRKFYLRYLSLPMPWILSQDTISVAPDANGRYHLMNWPNAPWYVEATFWNRYGPQAILARLVGRPIPQKGSLRSEGYRIEDIGPENFVGKGLEDHQKMVDELMTRDRAGCPFS